MNVPKHVNFDSIDSSGLAEYNNPSLGDSQYQAFTDRSNLSDMNQFHPSIQRTLKKFLRGNWEPLESVGSNSLSGS